MPGINEILRRLSISRRRAEIDREIDEELRHHLELRVRSGVESGLTTEEAEAEARRRFGDYERIRESCREISSERLEREMPMQMIKGFIWVMLGCGIALKLGSDIRSVQLVGNSLIMISLLWRLLLYLRTLRPSGGRAEELALSLTDDPKRKSVFGGLTEPAAAAPADYSAPAAMPARDGNGRTPVERLLADDE